LRKFAKKGKKKNAGTHNHLTCNFKQTDFFWAGYKYSKKEKLQIESPKIMFPRFSIAKIRPKFKGQNVLFQYTVKVHSQEFKKMFKIFHFHIQLVAKDV
jgi:hypothetical protein